LVAKFEYEFGGDKYIGINSINSMLPLTQLKFEYAEKVLTTLLNNKIKITRKNVTNKIYELYPSIKVKKQEVSPEEISTKKATELAHSFRRLLHLDKLKVIESYYDYVEPNDKKEIERLKASFTKSEEIYLNELQRQKKEQLHKQPIYSDTIPYPFFGYDFEKSQKLLSPQKFSELTKLSKP